MEQQQQTLNKIVDYLKHYPFLLVSLAGMVILTVVLAFDIDKLKELKWLLFAVILLPIVMQFFFEAKKQSHHQSLQKHTANTTETAAPQTTAHSGEEPQSTQLKYSNKTIIACIFWVMCLITFADSTEEELFEDDLLYGILLFAGAGLWLSIAALNEIRKKEASGIKLTIANIVICCLCLLSALGWLSDAPY